MRFSVFTPTHDPTHLLQAYRGLKIQRLADWEWIVQPNGPTLAPTFEIPEPIRADPRVRLLPWCPADGIGGLKKMCCLHAQGELLVELDHDDFFTPNAFESIAQTRAETEADFLYSDNVHFFPDHASELYDKCYGWEHYRFPHDDKQYFVNRSFPVDARSMCEIFWAPDHVRVWSREAYNKLGGHSGRLPIGDDHDLLCRTYLAGMKFAFIDRPLYFYRRYDANSFVKDNAAVQQQQTANRDKYLHDLIFEWCRREGLPMIDLGGGHGCPKDKGFLSLDADPRLEPDIRCDILQGIPVPDHSVGCFRASDFLEHIPTHRVVWLMNHLYDKLVPGGWIISSTPSVTDNDGKVGRGAFQDPTHCSFWSENNFWYFCDANYSRYVGDIRCRFQAVRVWTGYPSDWHRQHQVPYVRADLIALKGQRTPGRQLI